MYTHTYTPIYIKSICKESVAVNVASAAVAALVRIHGMNFVWVPLVVFRTHTQQDVSASLRSFPFFLNISRVCYFFSFAVSSRSLCVYLCHLFERLTSFIPQNFKRFVCTSDVDKLMKQNKTKKRMTESNKTYSKIL